MTAIAVAAQNKTNTYDISINGINVGTLTASKEVANDKTTYTVDSKSVVHFFGETTVTTSVVAIFRNGLLESSIYTSEKDGNSYDSNIIIESNGVYTLNRKGKKSTQTLPIKKITALLYFEEPEAGTIYYDVLSGTNAPIESILPNTFTYQSPESREKTTYTYNNNVLEKGVTNYILYSFTYTAKN